MSIEYLPSKLISKMAPTKLVSRLVNENLSLNRVVLSLLARSGILSEAKLQEIALKVLKDYKTRYKEEIKSGAPKVEAREAATNDNALMVQRVQDSITREVAKDIKREYRGEFYRWLPSNADVPDPLHQLKYGKKFQVGKGEMPGDRWGCQCGMEILVDETKLDI